MQIPYIQVTYTQIRYLYISYKNLTKLNILLYETIQNLIFYDEKL